MFRNLVIIMPNPHIPITARQLKYWETKQFLVDAIQLHAMKPASNEAVVIVNVDATKQNTVYMAAIDTR